MRQLYVNRTSDYDPNQTPVPGTLRWALFAVTGRRQVTVSPSVAAAGIDLNPSGAYGPIVVANSGLRFNGAGITIRYWGVTIAANDVVAENFKLQPNNTDQGNGLVIADGAGVAALHDVLVRNVKILASGPDVSEYPDTTAHPGRNPISIAQSNVGSTMRRITLENVTVEPYPGVWASKGVLVSGPDAGYIDGEISFVRLNVGGRTRPNGTAIRLPLAAGGLLHFIGCEFQQGWSTSDLDGGHNNLRSCKYYTRIEGNVTPAPLFWFAGRLVGVRGLGTAKIYVDSCSIDNVAVAGSALYKSFGAATDVDLPAGNISATILNTIPQEPVPTLTSISPASVNAGDPDTVVTLTGTGFNNGSYALVNGATIIATTLTDLVTGTTATVTIPAALLAGAGTVTIAVVNPAPGGGTSAAKDLTVASAGPVTTTITIDSSTNPDDGGKITFNTISYARRTLADGDPSASFDGLLTINRVFAFFDLPTDPTGGGTITKVELLGTVSSVSGTHAVNIVCGDYADIGSAGPPPTVEADDVIYGWGVTGGGPVMAVSTATYSAGAQAIDLGSTGVDQTVGTIANASFFQVGIALSNEAAAGSVVFDASVGFGLRITYTP